MSVRLEALPELADLWLELEHETAAEGIGIAIADFGGFRTAADTALILEYKQDDYDAYADRERRAGRTPVPITGPWEDGSSRPIAEFGKSYHDYGAARDFKIVSKPASMTTQAAELRTAAIAESIGLRSGSSWGDRWHVQLPITLEQAREMWDDYAGSSSSSSGAASMTAVWVAVAFGVGVVAAIRYATGLAKWAGR